MTTVGIDFANPPSRPRMFQVGELLALTSNPELIPWGHYCLGPVSTSHDLWIDCMGPEHSYPGSLSVVVRRRGRNSKRRRSKSDVYLGRLFPDGSSNDLSRKMGDWPIREMLLAANEDLLASKHYADLIANNISPSAEEAEAERRRLT